MRPGVSKGGQHGCSTTNDEVRSMSCENVFGRLSVDVLRSVIYLIPGYSHDSKYCSYSIHGPNLLFPAWTSGMSMNITETM